MKHASLYSSIVQGGGEAAGRHRLQIASKPRHCDGACEAHVRVTGVHLSRGSRPYDRLRLPPFLELRNQRGDIVCHFQVKAGTIGKDFEMGNHVAS